MSCRRIVPLLLVLLAVLAGLASGCGPTYSMQAPKGFVRYEERAGFAWITADGVRLRAREEANYPKADLPFWVDALKRHLQARGYVAKSDRCFKTAQGLDGCTLDFVLPHGAEDWVLSETVFVVDDRIVLLEVAGPFDRYAKVEQAVREALPTFEPGS